MNHYINNYKISTHLYCKIRTRSHEWMSIQLIPCGNPHAAPFLWPPGCVKSLTKRIKVHSIRLLSVKCGNADLILFQHLKLMFAKGVPRMNCGSPGLQYWIYNHVLPVSREGEHRVRSLNRAKFLLISKVAVVTHIWPLDTLKFVSKMIKIVIK